MQAYALVSAAVYARRLKSARDEGWSNVFVLAEPSGEDADPDAASKQAAAHMPGISTNSAPTMCVQNHRCSSSPLALSSTMLDR